MSLCYGVCCWLLDLQLCGHVGLCFRVVLGVCLGIIMFGDFVFPRASGIDSVLGLTFWFGYFGRVSRFVLFVFGVCSCFR